MNIYTILIKFIEELFFYTIYICFFNIENIQTSKKIFAYI